MNANETMSFRYNFKEFASGAYDEDGETRYSRVWFVSARDGEGRRWEMTARDENHAAMLAHAGVLTEDFEFTGHIYGSELWDSTDEYNLMDETEALNHEWRRF